MRFNCKFFSFIASYEQQERTGDPFWETVKVALLNIKTLSEKPDIKVFITTVKRG